MKKSTFRTLLCFGFIFMSLAGCANTNPSEPSTPSEPSSSAPAGTEGLEFFPLNDSECAVSAGNAKLLKNIVIPKTYNQYKVTEILEEGFESCKVENIVIPDSVTTIGSYAFSKSALTTIIFKEGSHLETIGERAFSNCSSLTSINIPHSVTSIGSYAFNGCKLDTIIISDSVTYIGEYAFQQIEYPIVFCEAKTKPAKWDEEWYTTRDYGLRPAVVYWGYSTNDVILEQSDVKYYIKHNGDATLIKLSKSLKSITTFAVPSYISYEGTEYSVTKIGDRAFGGFTSLKAIALPDSITSIGDEAFSDCYSITSIFIPYKVASIGNYAFAGTSLRTIIIPRSVTSMGYWVFTACTSLKIFCEVASKPAGWHKEWNYDYKRDQNGEYVRDGYGNYVITEKPVYWGGQWKYDNNNNPVPIK